MTFKTNGLVETHAYEGQPETVCEPTEKDRSIAGQKGSTTETIVVVVVIYHPLEQIGKSFRTNGKILDLDRKTCMGQQMAVPNTCPFASLLQK
jgi:hypothetical protein